MRRGLVAVLGIALAAVLIGVGYWLGERSEGALDGALDGADPADIRGCIEWTERAPTASELYGGCGEPGDVLIGFAVVECEDGRELYMGDIGWGFVGEPMTGGERVSDDVRAQCDGFTDASRSERLDG